MTCALCGQTEGHTPRCSVTKFNVDPERFRMGPDCPYCHKPTSAVNARCALRRHPARDHNGERG